jgi:hypothetical protein
VRRRLVAVAAVAAASASVGVLPAGSESAGAAECSPAVTRGALTSFVGAFNRGDSAELDALFARPPVFRWYSSGLPGVRRLSAAANRGTLVDYFRTRHLKRDRMRLTSFRFNGNSAGYGHFAFTLKRSAADYPRGAWFGVPAKGAAVCSDDPAEPPVQLAVLSLGAPRP